MARYRTKPVEIEAVQLRWSTWNQVCEFLSSHGYDWGAHTRFYITAEEVSKTCEEPGPEYIGLTVTTVHGETATVHHGDYIIPEPVPGHFYPCKPDVFKEKYEVVQL